MVVNSFVFKDKCEKLDSTYKINLWLNTICSDKIMSTSPFGEGRKCIAGGQLLVSIDELKKMVDNGDNIIRAEYFEDDGKILIEYERFETCDRQR